MKLRKIILENYIEAAAEFTQLAGNPAEVNQTIETFKTLINRGVFNSKEQNINYWRMQGWKAFKTKVAELSQNLNINQQNTATSNPATSQLQSLLNAPQLDHKAIVPLLLSSKDPDSSIAYIQKYSSIAKKPVSVPDSIIVSALQRNNGMQANSQLVRMIDFSNISNTTLSMLIKDMPGQLAWLYDRLTPQQQSVVHKNPRAIELLISRNRGPMPKLEDVIATDGKNSQVYAEHNLGNKPFKKGEKAIAKLPMSSVVYATTALNNKRFPAGEKAIATSDQASFEYARQVIGGEWPEGEKAIATNGQYSYAYAVDITNKRFPAGEAAMEADGLLDRYNAVFEKKDAENKNNTTTNKDSKGWTNKVKSWANTVKGWASGKEEPPESTAQPPESTAQPPESTAQSPESTAQPPESTAQPPESTAQPPESNNNEEDEAEDDEDNDKEFSGYYVIINSKAKGPYEIPVLQKMMSNGEITDQTSVWGEDLDSWTPVSEVEDITELLVTDQKYFVIINGTQYGPYMFNALKIMINGQQIDKNAKVWRRGLKGWTTIAKLPELNTKTDYEYYYEDANGETAGPHDFNEMQQMLADKQITKKTDVWRDELEDWTPLRQIPEFKSDK